MKLFKLFLVLCFLCQSGFALNFNGVQSLSGLNTTRIFTAPASGIYFVQGYLNLPWGSNTGGDAYSQVIVTVSKNYVQAATASVLYTGAKGASGFHLPSITLVSNDLITVGLSSPVTSDSVSGQGINAITGQVYYGNNF